MNNKQHNTDFFSYQGTINRKNYIINLLILVALFIGCTFINIEGLTKYTNWQFLKTILMYLIGFLKFAVLISGISVVYRRITDITSSKSIQLQEYGKKLFIILCVFPILYLYCIRIFLDIVPILTNILDLIVIFLLIPLATILLLILCFIKG